MVMVVIINIYLTISSIFAIHAIREKPVPIYQRETSSNLSERNQFQFIRKKPVPIYQRETSSNLSERNQFQFIREKPVPILINWN
jgi:glutaredoxin 2